MKKKKNKLPALSRARLPLGDGLVALFAVMVLLSFLPQSLHAAGCTDFDAVNPSESFRAVNNNVIDTRNAVAELLDRGSDPCEKIVPMGGKAGFLGATGQGITTFSSLASSLCPRSSLRDQAKCPAFEFPACFGTPGDEAHQGVADCTFNGAGEGTPLISGGLPTVIAPEIESIKCLGNILLSINFNVSSGGACATASLGAICNLSTQGAICTAGPKGDQDPGIEPPEGYVGFVGVENINVGEVQTQATPDAMDGTFLAPEGATFDGVEILPDTPIYIGPIPDSPGEYGIQFTILDEDGNTTEITQLLDSGKLNLVVGGEGTIFQSIDKTMPPHVSEAFNLANTQRGCDIEGDCEDWENPTYIQTFGAYTGSEYDEG